MPANVGDKVHLYGFEWVITQVIDGGKKYRLRSDFLGTSFFFDALHRRPKLTALEFELLICNFCLRRFDEHQSIAIADLCTECRQAVEMNESAKELFQAAGIKTT